MIKLLFEYKTKTINNRIILFAIPVHRSLLTWDLYFELVSKYNTTAATNLFQNYFVQQKRFSLFYINYIKSDNLLISEKFTK